MRTGLPHPVGRSADVLFGGVQPPINENHESHMIYTYLFVAAWAVYCAWDDHRQINRGGRIATKVAYTEYAHCVTFTTFAPMDGHLPSRQGCR